MTEFTQQQWEEWRGKRSLLEEKVKAMGFEVRGWMNGKPLVPRMFPKDLTTIALSIKEKRAKYSTPPIPEPEPEEKEEPVSAPGRSREDRIEAVMEEFTRDELRDKLKDADIKFSWRALERNLAEKVVDADLA